MESEPNAIHRLLQGKSPETQAMLKDLAKRRVFLDWMTERNPELAALTKEVNPPDPQP